MILKRINEILNLIAAFVLLLVFIAFVISSDYKDLSRLSRFFQWMILFIVNMSIPWQVSLGIFGVFIFLILKIIDEWW